MKRLRLFISELRLAMQQIKSVDSRLSSIQSEIANLRLDVNALRVAQAKANHRQAAEVSPETLGKPFGLSKEQAEQVDWSRVR